MKQAIVEAVGTVCILSLLMIGCGDESEGQPVDIPGERAEYIVLAWNDLGMHCLNPTYDQAVLLPPYNTIWAQVVRRARIPELLTEGITVEYRIVDNTYSYGKTDDLGGVFGQFWDHVEQLFGVSLDHDMGLNLADPSHHNGLSGQMVLEGDHFVVHGIPVTPVDDSGVWNPYQVAEITVRDSAGQVLVQTRTTVPTSDEIHCDRCHGTQDTWADILEEHDDEHETSHLGNEPILCASCHGSPALGTTGRGSAGKYLSEAIHGAHAERGATCYDCHPGPQTQCSRSLSHTAPDGNCTTCHGSMDHVASTQDEGDRIPWVDEPQCRTCHGNVAGLDTGGTLYRNSTGHGGIYCAGCHGSPHAQVPSRIASDSHPMMQYQGAGIPLGSCAVCHDNSRGGGLGEFAETHGGSGGRTTACHTCHTELSSDSERWPHSYQWRPHGY